MEEGAATPLTEESLSISVDIITAYAKEPVALDSGQSHTVQVEKLEAHLDDDVLHGHVASHKFDKVDLFFIDRFIIPVNLAFVSILIVNKEVVIILRHQVNSLVSPSNMLMQVILCDPLSAIFFVVDAAVGVIVFGLVFGFILFSGSCCVFSLGKFFCCILLLRHCPLIISWPPRSSYLFLLRPLCPQADCFGDVFCRC